MANSLTYDLTGDAGGPPSNHRFFLLHGEASKQRRIVSFLRWCVPFVLFCIVALYETYEHVLVAGELRLDVHLTSEILFFGGIGPAGVFIVLSFMQGLMEQQWQTQAQLDSLNRDLKQKVAKRTAELEARNAELRQLDELKSEFVSMVSHELRAPLTTLQGGLELALQQPNDLPSAARRRLEVMHTESKRLTAFVQRILDLSRLEAGRLPIVLGPIALRPLLKRSVHIVIGDKRRVDWHLPANLPPLIGDETHLEEAVRNLLCNADKYSPPGEPIRIDVKPAATCVAVSITDYGPGIPVESQRRIFDRFYRGHGIGDIQDTQGWGLGLYLSRRLIEAQGGKVEVASPVQPSSAMPGSCFTISMPLDLEGTADHAKRVAD